MHVNQFHCERRKCENTKTYNNYKRKKTEQRKSLAVHIGHMFVIINVNYPCGTLICMHAPDNSWY